MEGPRGHDDRGCSRSTGASAHPHSHPYTLSTWWGRKVDTTLTQGKTQFNLNPPPSLLLAAGSSQRVGGCHAGERWRVNDHRRLHPASVDPSACPPTHRSINVARDWSWRGPGRLPPPSSLSLSLSASFPRFLLRAAVHARTNTPGCTSLHLPVSLACVTLPGSPGPGGTRGRRD